MTQVDARLFFDEAFDDDDEDDEDVDEDEEAVGRRQQGGQPPHGPQQQQRLAGSAAGSDALGRGTVAAGAASGAGASRMGPAGAAAVAAAPARSGGGTSSRGAPPPGPGPGAGPANGPGGTGGEGAGVVESSAATRLNARVNEYLSMAPRLGPVFRNVLAQQEERGVRCGRVGGRQAAVGWHGGAGQGVHVGRVRQWWRWGAGVGWGQDCMYSYVAPPPCARAERLAFCHNRGEQGHRGLAAQHLVVSRCPRHRASVKTTVVWTRPV